MPQCTVEIKAQLERDDYGPQVSWVVRLGNNDLYTKSSHRPAYACILRCL